MKNGKNSQAMKQIKAIFSFTHSLNSLNSL